MDIGKLLVVFYVLVLINHEQYILGEYCTFMKEDDVTSCGDTAITKNSCLSLGCCWNTTISNGNYSCYRSKHLNGTCVKYPEDGICFKYLNSSVPQYREHLRFIDDNMGLNKTNKILEEFQKLINVVALNELNKTCFHTVRHLLCHYILPPCDDGSFIQICRQDCEMYEKVCPGRIQKLVGAAIISLHRSKNDFAHLTLPECYKLDKQKDLSKVGRKCYLTGFFDQPPVNMSDAPANTPKEREKSKDKIIIITSVVVVSVLLVTLVLFLLVCRLRMKRKVREHHDMKTCEVKKAKGRKFPFESVKDHINMLKENEFLKPNLPINDVKMIRQFPVDNVAYEKELGEGQFGQVFQGRAIGLNDEDPDMEVIVAVKTLKKGFSEETKRDFDQEACLMNYLHHPNIVRLLAVSAIEQPYCMIFEFMRYGDLSEYLRKSKPLKEENKNIEETDKNYLSREELIRMCVDVAKGMEHLASHHLIHRDVATRNCLVADDLTIKIADFGMSRDIYSNNYYKIEKDTVLPIRWLSPESILYGKFTIESDIYSYGVLMWEIFTFSMRPYYGYTNKQVLNFIVKGVRLGKPDFCPHFVFSIMKKCWRKDPKRRPFYNEVMSALNGETTRENEPRNVVQATIKNFKQKETTEHNYQNFIAFSKNAHEPATVVNDHGSQKTQTDPLLENDSVKEKENKSRRENGSSYKNSTSSENGSVNTAHDDGLDDEINSNVMNRQNDNETNNVSRKTKKTYLFSEKVNSYNC